MRKLVSILFFVSLLAVAQEVVTVLHTLPAAAPTYVDGKAGQTSASGTTVSTATFTTDVNQGDCIVCGIAWHTTTGILLTSVTDDCGSSGSNTYTLLDNPTNWNSTFNNKAASAITSVGKAGTGNSCTVTATLDTTSTIGRRIVCHLVRGANASPLDGTAHAISPNSSTNGTWGTTDSATSGNITASASTYIFGWINEGSGNNTMTLGTGYSNLISSPLLIYGEGKQFAAGGTVAATFTGDGVNSTRIVVGVVSVKP